MHAISGCDTVSSFYGNRTAWAVWHSMPHLNPIFVYLSCDPSQISNDDMDIIERYVVLLYQQTSVLSHVNEARKEFAFGNCKIETFLQHYMHWNNMWKRLFIRRDTSGDSHFQESSNFLHQIYAAGREWVMIPNRHHAGLLWVIQHDVHWCDSSRSSQRVSGTTEMWVQKGLHKRMQVSQSQSQVHTVVFLFWTM